VSWASRAARVASPRAQFALPFSSQAFSPAVIHSCWPRSQSGCGIHQFLGVSHHSRAGGVEAAGFTPGLRPAWYWRTTSGRPVRGSVRWYWRTLRVLANATTSSAGCPRTVQPSTAG
jgi:hypothetical protein